MCGFLCYLQVYSPLSVSRFGGWLSILFTVLSTLASLVCQVDGVLKYSGYKNSTSCWYFVISDINGRLSSCDGWGLWLVISFLSILSVYKKSLVIRSAVGVCHVTLTLTLSCLVGCNGCGISSCDSGRISSSGSRFLWLLSPPCAFCCQNCSVSTAGCWSD